MLTIPTAAHEIASIVATDYFTVTESFHAYDEATWKLWCMSAMLALCKLVKHPEADPAKLLLCNVEPTIF